MFAAVGAVQRDSGNENRPTCVAHYWPDYDQRLTAGDKQPRHFLDFVSRGHAERRGSCDIYPVVERVAQAMLRLAEIPNPAVRHPRRASCHRHVMSLLADDNTIRDRYLSMTYALATGRRPANEREWAKWSAHIIRIAQPLLCGAEAGTSDSFLDWVAEEASELGRSAQRDNIFR